MFGLLELCNSSFSEKALKFGRPFYPWSMPGDEEPMNLMAQQIKW